MSLSLMERPSLVGASESGLGKLLRKHGVLEGEDMSLTAPS